jgi:hypothetical protein
MGRLDQCNLQADREEVQVIVFSRLTPELEAGPSTCSANLLRQLC